MITKLDSSAPISNMYVRREVTSSLFLFLFLKHVVDCDLGMISSGGSKFFTTLHTTHLYYAHKIMVQRPQVPLVIL